jgi:hypothetical protein
VTKYITKGLILTTILSWIVWDIYVAIEPTPGDTESETIRDWAWAHPAFPFAVGAIMGHFFWNREEGRFFSWSPWLLGGLGLAAAVIDVVGLAPTTTPVIPFLVGLPLGALLWPQRPAKEQDDGNEQRANTE